MLHKLFSISSRLMLASRTGPDFNTDDPGTSGPVVRDNARAA